GTPTGVPPSALPAAPAIVAALPGPSPGAPLPPPPCPLALLSPRRPPPPLLFAPILGTTRPLPLLLRRSLLPSRPPARPSLPRALGRDALPVSLLLQPLQRSLP